MAPRGQRRLAASSQAARRKRAKLHKGRARRRAKRLTPSPGLPGQPQILAIVQGFSEMLGRLAELRRSACEMRFALAVCTDRRAEPVGLDAGGTKKASQRCCLRAPGRGSTGPPGRFTP